MASGSPPNADANKIMLFESQRTIGSTLQSQAWKVLLTNQHLEGYVDTSAMVIPGCGIKTSLTLFSILSYLEFFADLFY
jgi:hypothetical protein